MKLPGHESAIVPDRKITAFLLSLTHRDGRSKAALKRHAADHEVVATETTVFGTNYVVEGPLLTPDGRSPGVRVVWFIAAGERIPTLVTAYLLKGASND